MKSKDVLLETSRKVLEGAIKLGFDEVAVSISRRKEVMVKIANSEPSVVQRWSVLNVGLYLSKDKRIFVVSCQPAKVEDAELLVRDISALVQRATPSPFYAPLPGPQPIKPLSNLVDSSILKYMENPAEIAERMIEAAFRNKIDSVAGMIDLTYGERVLVTSKEVCLYEDATSLETYIRAFAGKGSGQWAFGSRRLNMLKLEEVAKIASNFALESKNPEPAKPGVYDVVLSPMVVGNLFNLVAMMSSAFSVLMGLSIFMRNKPGDKVASSNLTLIDDVRNPSLPGSTAFDDEGIPTFTKPIIEGGLLKTLLHNTKTAVKMKAKPTGNAGWIVPHAWNLRVELGEYSFEELISEVRKGLLITNNWYTRLQNYVEGLFSTIARDALFLIENGEITKPLTKLRIADRLPTLLNNIVALGKEPYDIKWWEVGVPTRTPYVLAKSIHTSKHVV